MRSLRLGSVGFRTRRLEGGGWSKSSSGSSVANGGFPARGGLLGGSVLDIWFESWDYLFSGKFTRVNLTVAAGWKKINTEIASGRLSCWRLAELAASSEEAKEETDKR